MAKHKQHEHVDRPDSVYPAPTSDSAGERTGNVAPTSQKPIGPPPEENAAPAVPTVGESVAKADAELARLRVENAELKRSAESANPAPVGEGAKAFRVGGPGLMERSVKADDEAGAKRAYMAALGVWSLPHDPTVIEE